MWRHELPLVCAVVFFAGSAVAVNAGLIVFDRNINGGITGFNTEAGNPPISIDFDDIAPGTNMDGASFKGVTFSPSTNGAPLVVVRGEDTFTPEAFTGLVDAATNKLSPTTGSLVLSPGGLTLGPGANDAVENDDLVLVFQLPVSAFGFDHLSQSADGVTFTTVQVFNQADDVLFNGNIPISNLGGGGGSPGGADFWGAVATDGDLISRIVIDERDNNAVNPDSNVGFDSLRFHVVPEPSTLGIYSIGIFLFRYRRQDTRS